MSSSIHILILDDEVIAGLGLQSVIRKMGFDRVHIAGSYEKAVEISRTHQINVAIVDINLNQQKNGIDFVDENGPFDKTIFLSGYHRSLYEKELKNVSFDMYLEKPIRYELLQPHLQELGDTAM